MDPRGGLALTEATCEKLHVRKFEEDQFHRIKKASKYLCVLQLLQGTDSLVA